MSKNTQAELDEIEQVIRSVLTPNSYIVPQEGIKLTKAILDWHNKQLEKTLENLLVDVSSPNASIDQAEMIELISLYINKLKESK